MTKDELEDARTLWKMFYAGKTFEHVEKTCAFISQQNFDTSHPAYYSLVTSVYVLYGRPFRDSRPVGKPSDEIVPLEHKETHTALLAHRDKIYAHTDAKAFDLDEIGNVNQVRFLVPGGEFRLFATQLRAQPIALGPISELCKALQEKTEYAFRVKSEAVFHSVSTSAVASI